MTGITTDEAGRTCTGESSPKVPGPSRRIAIIMSFICPGLPQVLRGHWVRGILQLLLFLGGAATAVIPALVQLIVVYRSALAVADDPGAELASWDQRVFYTLAGGAAAALLGYLWSLWDAGKKPRCHRS